VLSVWPPWGHKKEKGKEEKKGGGTPLGRPAFESPSTLPNKSSLSGGGGVKKKKKKEKKDSSGAELAHKPLIFWIHLALNAHGGSGRGEKKKEKRRTDEFPANTLRSVPFTLCGVLPVRRSRMGTKGKREKKKKNAKLPPPLKPC